MLKPGTSVTQESSKATHEISGLEKKEERSLNDLSAIRELINLQEKQTELSALIANQLKISSLPVQDPPVFNGNALDHTAFIQAFEAIIQNKVDSNKGKLFFSISTQLVRQMKPSRVS